MKPLRLCLIIPTLDLGGAEKQLCMLAQGLDRSVIEPYVVCLTRGGPREESLRSAQVPYEIIGKRFKVDPWAYLRLVKTIRKIAPDIVHTWIFAANAYGRMAALQAKVPVVVGGERCVDPWKRRYEFWIDRFLAKRTQGILCNSGGIVDFYASNGLPPSKFSVIPNGIALPQQCRSNPGITREEACRRLQIPTDRKIIAAVGRLWPQKGYKDLFWAIELLRVARNDLVFVVIGDGPLRQRLELYRDQLRAAGTVVLVGERKDVPDLMPHFDILVNGSQYEGQSNSILEAMSMEVPVVASDIPGNRDLVVDGETGYFFPYGDTYRLTQILNDLLNAPQQIDKLGSAGRRRIATEFTVEQMVARHQEVYQRLSSLSR